MNIHEAKFLSDPGTDLSELPPLYCRSYRTWNDQPGPPQALRVSSG